MDRLSPLLNRFDLSARVFHTGALCGWADFDESDGVGHLHILRSGSLRTSRSGQASLEVVTPSLLFYPSPSNHRLVIDDGKVADVLCASVDFGSASGNPLLRGLPELLVVPMNAAPALQPTLDLLFAEAGGERCARQAALDRLLGYLIIQLLRHAMAERLIDVGVLAGLADPRLSKAITAMHEQPGHPWSLEELAQAAGMSRARFAVNFRETTGATPMDYLTDWRLGIARTLLKKGLPVKRVAADVGYASSTSFARAFAQRCGTTPKRWLGSN